MLKSPAVRLPSFVFIFVLIFGLSFNLAAKTSSPTLDRVLTNKELRVGVSGTQPPLNVKNRQGKLIGYEIELAGAIASALGVEARFVVTPFGELLNDLRNDKVDLVMSGMTITAERSRTVSFIGPYLMSGKAVLTRSLDLARATTSAAFNQSGYTLAALENSTSQKFVELVAPSAKLVKVTNYDEGVRLVIENKVDGLIADMPIGLLALLQYPDQNLLTSSQPLSIEPLGIAVKRGDAAFAEVVSNFLETYRRMGILEKLRNKYLKENAWMVSLPRSREDSRPSF